MSHTVMLDSPPLPDGMPGEIIAGKYRLERELGRGAMGTVWLAMHTTLGQRVAIKLIAPEQAGSPEARRRFSLEAKAAARLKSRHVVQVYDDGETADGTPYIVMEYLDGETLEQRLERQRDIGLQEAVRVTMHIARALARAHAQGIVHRDLKPANVFLARTEDDELGWVAKVLDFGVAKLADNGASTTKTGTIVGTPLFMSPEQIRGASHVDHRADLYSLGMVFYNMVTGSHAFDGPSYSDVLVAICTEPLPDIRTAAPWLPAPLRVWFDKACAREREERFQSADELIEALQQAAGNAGRATRPSIPDDMGGPSGTLLGYSAPDNMAAVEASYVMLGAEAPQHEVAVASSGTLRSPTPANSPARRATPAVITLRPNRLPTLAVWGAAGVVLALLAALAVTVFARTFSSTNTGESQEPRRETTSPIEAPPATRERAQKDQAEPSGAAPTPEIAPHMPLPPAAATTTLPAQPAPPAAESSSARGRPSAGPRKPAQTPGRTPPAATPERPAAPDMGF